MTDAAASRAAEAVFFTGFAVLICHELDAVLHHEWRVLPLVRMLPDAVGYVVFVLAHVPLFVALMLMLTSGSARLRIGTRIGIDAFLLLHAVLHVLFRNHVHYDFAGWLSNGLIFGGAAVGALHLVLLRWPIAAVPGSRPGRAAGRSRAGGGAS